MKLNLYSLKIQVKKGAGYSTLYIIILVSQFITVVKGLLVMVIYMKYVISYSVAPKLKNRYKTIFFYFKLGKKTPPHPPSPLYYSF